MHGAENVGMSQLFFVCTVLHPLVRDTETVIPQQGGLVNPVITRKRPKDLRKRPQSYWT